ncbi:xylose isomerase-like TIM barrel [Andreesenia angusta]|uniref:Xylose isomerase-like TIM barrel n=1 Tax=Andreesenia angusta TaxID=39480 RepID=A0A1S1V5S9_9FIRM|nr:sugar phosphate isomerase/epimerase [Andreesenia angusta]OHW61948.1 xylose isomerase-like TIM barrel [Andreesenia angusta]
MHSQLGISIHGVDTEYVRKRGFKRVQICQKFSKTEDVTSLLKLSREKGIKISFHAPIFHQVDHAATYYLSKNFRLREATFEILEINMKMAQCLPSEYVVIHFTSKTMKDESYDSYEEMMKIARRSVKRLGKLAEKYSLKVNIEYASYDEKFRDPDEWIELVKDQSDVGICLDIGQLFTNCKALKLDFHEKLRDILPYTNAVHIWNTRDESDLDKFGYIPVNPSQSPEEGWIDIEKSIEIIKEQKREIPIIFEPNFDYSGEEYFSEGLDWVNNIIGKKELEKITV